MPPEDGSTTVSTERRRLQFSPSFAALAGVVGGLGGGWVGAWGGRRGSYKSDGEQPASGKEWV